MTIAYLDRLWTITTVCTSKYLRYCLYSSSHEGWETHQRMPSNLVGRGNIFRGQDFEGLIKGQKTKKWSTCSEEEKWYERVGYVACVACMIACCWCNCSYCLCATVIQMLLSRWLN